MAARSAALDRFRQAYAAMLVAAECLRVDLEQAAGGSVYGGPRDVAEIQRLVAANYNVSLPRLLGRARDVGTSDGRHVAMALCRDLTPHSLAVIGGAFSRHHTCVIQAVQNVAARQSQSPGFKTQYEALRARARVNLAQLPRT